MPISSLPDSTLRAITSTLVLTDAVSVVKELVDNALDAKATTIFIEISANTLDVIQVKDNGFGIGVEDRQLVCKRGCTSKIATIEDLERLGGTSLGFRGEALASVADLSESVTLTTRVDGELAGSKLNYGPAGALLSCSSASHPVGSTIRVKDFLKIIPVRRQTALKNATQTLSAIKKLLQGYAFARGRVRFSLKVLKGKNETANWSFTPVDSADKLRDLAARIVGKDVAGACQIRTKDERASGEEGGNYSAVALLGTIDSDAAKLKNTGHYISVDGRPVTTARGIIKEVVQLYRQYTRNGTTITQNLPASFDPLLVMHISCPRGSYDVNVEPAKDEVMFINPECILGLVKSLFKDYYGEPLHSDSASNSVQKGNSTPKANSSFSLLLAKRPTSPIESTYDLAKPLQKSRLFALSPQPSDKAPMLNGEPHMEVERFSLPVNGSGDSLELSDDNKIVEAIPCRAHSTMYGLDEDDEVPPPSPDPEDVDHDAKDVGDVVARNPWSLAKLNAPVRRSSELDESSPFPNPQFTSSDSPQLDEVLLHSTPGAGTHRQPLGLRPQLLSPSTSPRSPDIFQNPGPPKRPWPSRQRGEDLSKLEFGPEIPATPRTEGRRGVAQLLDTWAKPIVPRTELPSFKRVSEIYDKNGRFENTYDSNSPEGSRLQTSLKIADHGHPPQVAPLGHPFKLPLLGSPDGAATKNLSTSPPAPACQQTFFKLSQSQNLELDQIMEFEHRKRAANAQQRKGIAKAKRRDMSIAELSRLQQSTMPTSADDSGSRMMAGYQDDMNGSESRASAVVSFGDMFDNTAHLDNITKPSPHRNRYLAAAKRLTKGRTNDTDVEVHASGTSDLAEVIDSGNNIPSIPEGDPRAYLIQHPSQIINTGAGGLSRTGLKIRRTKTQRLPLEVIPPQMMLHDVVALTDFDVQRHAEVGPGTDRYTATGKNDFITWSSSLADILIWQDRLTTLVESAYRARIGDELIPPNVGLDLRRMIKIHCDNI